MSPINPATFAANLRAEMGRQNFHPQWLVERGAVNREPTPDEIDAIVLCLGCPESRLLVSREELEALHEIAKIRASFARQIVRSVLRAEARGYGWENTANLCRSYLEDVARPLTSADEHNETAVRPTP